MSKRERIEDLGRLSVKLRNIYDDDLFDIMINTRPKYAWDVFSRLDEDQKLDIIEKIAYGLERIKESISECLCIADGDEE